MYQDVFPDLRVEIEGPVAGGDKIARRLRITGTQQGELGGVASSGKKIGKPGF